MNDLTRTFDRLDRRITTWMARYGLLLLRLSLGIVDVYKRQGSDGGEFGDVLTEEVLEPGSFDVHRMYWYGVVAHSELQSDTSLTGGSVVERLRQDLSLIHI